MGFMQGKREILEEIKNDFKVFGLRNRKMGVVINLDKEVWERDRQGGGSGEGGIIRGQFLIRKFAIFFS